MSCRCSRVDNDQQMIRLIPCVGKNFAARCASDLDERVGESDDVAPGDAVEAAKSIGALSARISTIRLRICPIIQTEKPPPDRQLPRYA